MMVQTGHLGAPAVCPEPASCACPPTGHLPACVCREEEPGRQSWWLEELFLGWMCLEGHWVWRLGWGRLRVSEGE